MRRIAGSVIAGLLLLLTVECADHSLIPVTVGAGETVEGIEVRDWYAPPGTFPERPREPE